MHTTRHYIGGRWTAGEAEATFDAMNPANGTTLAHVAEGTRADAANAARAAAAGSKKLAAMSVWDRSQLCLRIADAIDAHKDELAHALTLDQGKPLHSEAMPEVDYAAGIFRDCAEQIKWLETSVIPVKSPCKRVFSFRQPRGAYAVLTPWNFPYLIPSEYLAPGLAAGNAISWIPAPTTSYCATRFVEAILEADLPPGVLNLVTGPGRVVGDELVGHPLTNAIGFTGSPATGEQIMRRAAGKPCLLELGGNGPTIILDDADVGAAAAAAASGCWFNAGQVCCATERILASSAIYEAVVEAVTESASQVVLGDPMEPCSTMGPLNNAPTADKIDRHIVEAVEQGARVAHGGGRAENRSSNLYYRPTVLEGVTSEMAISGEETFGPVAPVTRVETDEEALALADDNDFGLVSAVFTRNLSRAFHFAETLRSGIVVVNDFTDYWETHIPFGGASGKRSGFGRIGGRHAIMEMTDLKTVCIDVA